MRFEKSGIGIGVGIAVEPRELIDYYSFTFQKQVFSGPISPFLTPKCNTIPFPPVSASMEMLRRFDQLKKTWASTEEPFGQVGLGIGISSGEMFLGNVGSQRRLDYTVIGTDVNISQRLASEAVSGQILMTESVKSQLDSRFRVTQEPSRLLRGLEKKIPVFSIGTE